MADRSKLTSKRVTAAVVKLLYDAGAPSWTVQEKGVFIAAVKQQLAERAK